MLDPIRNETGINIQDSLATSRSLLERARSNDVDAWNRLVDLYSPLVYRWCRRWRLQDEDIADVFQEVFRSAAQNLASFRKERPQDCFRGWLRVITVNKVRDHHRRLRREPRAEGGTEAQRKMLGHPSPMTRSEESTIDPPENAALVHQALEHLRKHFAQNTWQAFWRTAVDGRSAPEVAKELSMTDVGVRVAKSRVLQRLREELGDLLV